MLNLFSAALVLFEILPWQWKQSVLKIIILDVFCIEQQKNLLGLKIFIRPMSGFLLAMIICLRSCIIIWWVVYIIIERHFFVWLLIPIQYQE